LHVCPKKIWPSSRRQIMLKFGRLLDGPPKPKEKSKHRKFCSGGSKRGM
jgi:hypothetical protein